MKRVKLGTSGIEVSRLGIGTGTEHPPGHCAQALMGKKELAKLLLYSFRFGINFWDTAFQYKTYPHIKEALKQVSRKDIVLATKLTTANEKETTRDFTTTIKGLGVDYVDICLLHGVRTKTDLYRRSGAFNTLLKLKSEGKVRAVGLSSHGLSALESVLKIPEIDVVWARTNYAGINMDTYSLGTYDRLASIHWLKKVAKLLPRRLLSFIRPLPGQDIIPAHKRKEVGEVLQKIKSQDKGIVGMKVLAEGRLKYDTKRAIEYVSNLPYVDSFIIGMLSKNEIEENCMIVNTSEL